MRVEREGRARRHVFPEGSWCSTMSSGQGRQRIDPLEVAKWRPPWQEQFQRSGRKENPTGIGEERVVCEEEGRNLGHASIN